MFEISETHYAATWLLHPNAPKLDPPAIVQARIKKMLENKNAAEAGESIVNGKDE